MSVYTSLAPTEARGNRHAVNVIETNGPEMESLAREQMLAEFHSPHLADIPAAILPKHGLWIPDRLNFFVVAYNPRKFKPEDLPKSYEGFLDPKWRGRIALEATDAEWMGGVVKTWGEARGMNFFRKLAEMKPDMRQAPHPHAALLFADFMLSREAQEPMAGMGRTPVHRGVKTETSAMSDVMSDPAVILDEHDKWQGLWEKLFLSK